jgi:putative hydroxymethylpyrimidine transport system permease protein
MTRPERRARRAAAVLLPAALVAALLGAWEIYARAGGIDEFILPSPSAIAAALWEDRSLLWDQFAVTAGEILLGVAVAIVLGLACALAIHLSGLLRRAAYPLLVASQTIPIVIIAPLLVAWLGYDLAPKLAIVALVCFFPVTVTALDGLATVEPEQRTLMRSLRASRWQSLRFVELPAAAPAVFSGARIAVVVAVIGAVLAEQAGSSEGLGHLITQAIPQFETAQAYAAVAVLSAFAILLFAAITALERALLPWATHSRQGSPT